MKTKVEETINAYTLKYAGGSMLTLGVNAKGSYGGYCAAEIESHIENFLYWDASKDCVISTDEWKDTIHYSERFALNQDESLPANVVEALEQGFEKLPKDEAKYHQLYADLDEYAEGACLKFVHENGREAVYKIVTKSENYENDISKNAYSTILLPLKEYPTVGPTFNYAPNDSAGSVVWWDIINRLDSFVSSKVAVNSIAHYYFDMLPYYWWGNVPSTPTPIPTPDPASVSVWNGNVATGFASGSGTEKDPYIIKTAEQLAYLANSVNNGATYSGEYIKLVKDIYLNDTFDWENWDKTAPKNVWIPIGTSMAVFKGTFDGDDYTVFGIYTDRTKDYQGLFGCSGGTIKNIGVEQSYIRGQKFVGCVCGDNNEGTVANCHGSGTVSGSDGVGGVCGGNAGVVMNSYGCGDFSGKERVGGVNGHNYYCNAILTGCYNYGNVSGSYRYCGGVCGDNYKGTVENSYNMGSVSGGWGTGGVCGVNYYGNIVTNCYNHGSVSGSMLIGGICGWNVSTVTNCYNIGSVDGAKRNIGGVCGNKYGTITNCYYLIDCATDDSGVIQYGIGAGNRGHTTVDVSGATTGLTNTQMQQQTSFDGFDFDKIWTMDENKYPKLVGAEAHKHIYGEWMKYDNTKHFCTCICGETQYENHFGGNGIVTIEPTHTEEGSATYTCKDCGYTYTVSLQKLGEHSFGEWQKKDDTTHSRSCECGETESEAHTYDSGKVTRQAAEGVAGERTYTCTVCGAVRTETFELQTEKISDAGSGVRIDGDSNALPAGTEIKVEKMTDTEIVKTFEEVKGNLAVVGENSEILDVFDITLENGGVEIQPDGTIQVTLPLTEAVPEGKTVTVVYIADDGTITPCTTVVNADGTVSFTTDHFSRYAVVVADAAPEPSATPTATPTAPVDPTGTPDPTATTEPTATDEPTVTPEPEGEKSHTVLFICIGAVALLAVAAVIVVVVLKKCRKD